MITQADSRKWMACLYNSFLFMEAKIMKMAKKLLALVLTGVMAVSMLTGCSLSDAVKAEALEKSLNSATLQGSTQKVNFNHKKDLDDEANKVWSQVLGSTDTARKEALNTQKATATATAKFVYDAKIGGTTAKNYAYIVVAVGDKKSEIKKSDKILGADFIYAATYKTNKLADDIKKMDNTGEAMKIVDAKATGANLSKVNFGVKFVDDGKDTKTYYAIVVVEVTK